MTDFRTPPAHEPGSQPDPMLEPPRSSAGVWAAGAAIFVIVAGTLYALNAPAPKATENETTAVAAPTQPAAGQQAQNSGDQKAGKETTGAAPKDQQADQQNGKGDAQKSGGNQAAPANSPNAAASQKDQSSQTNQQPPKQQ